MLVRFWFGPGNVNEPVASTFTPRFLYVRGEDRNQRRDRAMRRGCFLGSPLLRSQADERRRVVKADSQRLDHAPSSVLNDRGLLMPASQIQGAAIRSA